MKSIRSIDLTNVTVVGEGGERPTKAIIPKDESSPIVVLCSSLDPEGSVFDLRKALLLRDGHTFSLESLRELALIIQERRRGVVLPQAKARVVKRVVTSDPSMRQVSA